MNHRKPRLKPRATPVSAGYLATVRALDERRKDCGLSHEALCKRAGIAARSWAKIISPDTRSGRLASQATLDKARRVLFPALSPPSNRGMRGRPSMSSEASHETG